MSRTSIAALLALLLLAGAARAAEPEPPPRLSPAATAGVEYAAGVGAAAITVPSMLAAGTAIGRSTNDITAALVPSMLLLLIVPPVAVTATEWLVGDKALRGGARFHPAIWAAVAVNLVAVVLGAVAGVWTGDPASYGVFSVVDALAMPAAVTLVLHYRRRRPADKTVAPATIESRQSFLLRGDTRPNGAPTPAGTVGIVGVAF